MVASSTKGRATVKLFDGRTLEGVDVSYVRAPKGAFVEVFGGLALSVLTDKEARRRRAAWRDVMDGAKINKASEEETPKSLRSDA